MKLVGRLLLTASIVAAMVAAPTMAWADPLNPLTGVTLAAPSIPAVYPVVDGQMDTVTISGSVDAAAPRRVRATVTVSIGSRLLKTWPLSATGPFSFVWDGKSAGTVVPGAAVVRVRAVDDDGTVITASTPLTISPKKVTAVVYTKVVYPNMGFDCFDDLDLTWSDPGYGAHLLAICPFTFPATGDGTRGTLTMRGTKSVGPLYGVGYFDLPSTVQASLLDPVVSVTSDFIQKGAGNNSLWVCGDSSCSKTGVKNFTSSGAFSASRRLDGFVASPVTGISWMTRVGHGHDLVIRTWKIRITYYALR